MPIQLSRLWTRNRTIDRLPYLLTGMFLFLVKFTIDWTIATQGFGKSWSPLNYVIWPNDQVLRVFELRDPERWFSLTMLFVSLPFIWIGVILTFLRLRTAGLPLILVMFFFVPVVNLLLFLLLVLLPTRQAPARDDVAIAVPRQLQPLQRVHKQIVRESYWWSGLVALAISVPLVVVAVVYCAQMLESYGFSLFVGAPFALGMITVLVFGFSKPQPLGACLSVAMVAVSLAGLAIITIAIEGAFCLIMAAPIAFVLAFIGALLGYAIQVRPWLNDQTMAITLGVILLLPATMAAEWANEQEPSLREVRTEVIVNAKPERVWQNVIAFPPLAEPDDWLFQTGIAYPQRAEICGIGVGSVRHCIFSTGTFVEPIEVWEPPSLLRFRVGDQPEPMREWSPYTIHPPHLNHYLCSQKGEFQLEALSNGRTRLVGTTWYTNRMWPASYWNIWSDYIVHRIHGRVLEHIKALSEVP